MASRNSGMLSVLLLAVGVWILILQFRGDVAPSGGQAFLGHSPVRALPRQHIVMQGFKEDFEAWRSSLTPEEQKLIQEQAQGEFNKAYRKTEDFKKDLPEEKVKAFSKILGKFFENESDDYKKDMAQKVPDYDGLLKKAGDKKLDMSLKYRIVEIDRDADRRYHFASMKIRAAQASPYDYKFPQSSPTMERWLVQNNDTESHDYAVGVLNMMQEAAKQEDFPADVKPMVEECVKKGVPPVGEEFNIWLPEVLMTQVQCLQYVAIDWAKEVMANVTDEKELEEIKAEMPKLGAYLVNWLQANYMLARDDVERDVDNMKAFFRSQEKRKDEGLTKADILKEIWGELPKHFEGPVPPLDEEMLAELAQEPAVVPGEFMHSWGTADKLYKSEAIDAFGAKYLLGVFETKDEAMTAFNNWNVEYEKARADMKTEMAQWSKQEQAKLDRDSTMEGVQRIRKMLEEARVR